MHAVPLANRSDIPSNVSGIIHVLALATASTTTYTVNTKWSVLPSPPNMTNQGSQQRSANKIRCTARTSTSTLTKVRMDRLETMVWRELGLQCRHPYFCKT